MRLEVLGSGGAVTTPKPFCACAACAEARAKGAPYTRLGPSAFLHGPDILFDTPEEIGVELNRSGVKRIAACFYSHWHPDHTAGRRVFEMNRDWFGLPPEFKSTDVYVTKTIEETFRRFGGILNHFDFMEKTKAVKIRVIGDSETVALGDYRVTPIRLALDYVFGFIVSGEGKNVLIVMDELKNREPDAAVRGIRFDLAYLPLGIFDCNPFDGTRLIDPRHPLLQSEQTVAETLAVAQKLHARKIVLSHIEEPDGITLDLAQRLGEYYSKTAGRDIVLAYDTLALDV